MTQAEPAPGKESDKPRSVDLPAATRHLRDTAADPDPALLEQPVAAPLSAVDATCCRRSRRDADGVGSRAGGVRIGGLALSSMGDRASLGGQAQPPTHRPAAGTSPKGWHSPPVFI